MGSDPPEDAVSLVIEVTSVDRDTAIKYLKAKQNDTSRAISAVLDGENVDNEVTSLAWDEGAWGTDRDRPSQGPQAQTFYNSSAAPTRGSSPVPSLRQPKTQAEADDEMDKALAMSRQDFGSQESGLIDSSGNTTTSHFGKANQDHYDPNQWSMTLAKQSGNATQSVTELCPEVDALSRRHRDDVPRFIRQLPTGDYVPNLITIGHSIPLIRETWLMRSAVATDYGSDSEWWRGSEIRLPKVVHLEDMSPVDDLQAPEDTVLELQRLMAFLDSSSRLYGSAQALGSIVRSRNSRHARAYDTLIDQTLATWERAALNSADPEQSDSITFRPFHTSLMSSSPNGITETNLQTLPLTAMIENDSDGATTSLGETIDRAIWDLQSDNTDTLHDTFIEQCPDVLVMRAKQANPARSTLGLAVPTHFYVDKYLEENAESTRALRHEMMTLRAQISRSERVISRLEKYEHSAGSVTINAADMMKHTVNHYNGENRRVILEERESRGTEVDLPPLPAEYGDISIKLQGLCQDIDDKLRALREGIQNARAGLRRLSDSGSADGVPGQHRYSLRGVATKPSVTYLLRPKANSETSTGTSLLDDDADEDAPPGMQWWRVELDIPLYGNPRVLTTPSTTDDVIRAVELEHNSALLVYASESACVHPLNPSLPDALNRFIKLDNQAFQAELTEGTDNAARNSDVPMPYSDWPAEVQDLPRRASNDSTTVNYDDRNDGLPTYDVATQQSGSGQNLMEYRDERAAGLDHHVIKANAASDSLIDRVDSPPVHEIRLDDADDDGDAGDEIEHDLVRVNSSTGFKSSTGFSQHEAVQAGNTDSKDMSADAKGIRLDSDAVMVDRDSVGDVETTVVHKGG